MRVTAVLLAAMCLLPGARGEAGAKDRMRGFILAGERIIFDACVPRFTHEQIRATSQIVRKGLARWAATERGCALVRRFDRGDYRIFVLEDEREQGMGRAPQPAIGTMVSYDSPRAMKIYQVILNPAFAAMPGMNARPVNGPATASELMAAAWAGEMLHIDFYSRGIVLPHHQRSDFQREWLEIATELGYPALTHDDALPGHARDHRGRF